MPSFQKIPVAAFSALSWTLLFVLAEPASAAEAPPGAVWLSDIAETSAEVGKGSFGKGGDLGYGGRRIKVRGIDSPHGLSTYPAGKVEYRLEKKFATFRTTAAIDDSARVGRERRPVVFRVSGDGIPIWESRGLVEKGDAQQCLIDVANVEMLQLEVLFHPLIEGNGDFAYAVWVEPYLHEEPPRAAGPLPVPSFREAKRYAAGEKYPENVYARFAQENFDELERLAAEARGEGRMHEAQPLLSYFYAALSAPPKKEEADWKEHLAKLERWRAAKPESTAADIAAAAAWVDYAWHARGGGWAHEVTDEGWKLFGERLDVAAEILLEDEQPLKRDPHFYVVKAILAKGRGWPLESFRAMADEVLEKHPHYDPVYLAIANALLPRWLGNSPRAPEMFADLVRKKLGGEKGDVAYARIALWQWRYSGDERFFGEAGFDYDVIKRGMLAILHEHPASRVHLQLAARVACLAQDEETARMLLARIGSTQYVPTVWGLPHQLETWHRWAEPGRARGKELRTLWGMSHSIDAVVFSGDGRTIIGGGLDREIFYWDAASGEKTGRNLVSEGITSIAGGEGGRIAIASRKMDKPFNSVYVYEGGLVSPLQGHTKVVNALALSADGKHLATASDDGTARIWPTDKSSEPIAIEHGAKLVDVAYSPDGSTIATSTYKGGLFLWNAETGEPIGEPLVKNGQGPWICRIAFSPDGRELFTGSADGTLRRWDLSKRTFEARPQKGARIWDVAVSHDGRLLAVAQDDGKIPIMDARTFKWLYICEGHWGRVLSVAFSPDGALLASGSFDSTVKLWDIADVAAKAAR